MILGTKILLDLVKKKKLVEGLSQRELTNPEGAGFDLRLGEVYEPTGRGFLGIEERSTPEMKLVAKVGETKRFVLKPGKFYLVSTIEKLNMPKDLMGLFVPRSTLCRSGIQLLVGQADPGYCGKMNVGLVNLSSENFEIEPGARFMNVSFFQVKGTVLTKYRGQWQGGRTHTVRREKQV